MAGSPTARPLGGQSLLPTERVSQSEIHQIMPGRDLPSHLGEGALSENDASRKVVSFQSHHLGHSSQRAQGSQPRSDQARQCAEPTPIQHHASPPPLPLEAGFQQAQYGQRGSPKVVTGQLRPPKFSPTHDVSHAFANTNTINHGPTQSRRVRRKAADISRIIGKPWRDLDRAEKVCMAMASMERQGGYTISLNFGISRQLSCQKLRDPRRIFEKELNRQLNLVGLVGMNLVMTLEVTPHGSRTQSRVHAHGAVETARMSEDQISAFQTALKKAASIAVGAIGGDRQLVMKPMNSAGGWMDYCVEDQAKTKRALGISNLWVMTRPAQQAARAFHDEMGRFGSAKAA